MSAETERNQRVARVVDREVAPIWHDRFARMILRELPSAADQFVLDVHAGAGRTTGELLTRLDDSARVLAIEPNPAFIARAKGRMQKWGERVYFKEGDVDLVADMGENTYDLTVANLVLGDALDWAGVMGELLRVTKPGGQVKATLPFDGTWAEAEDLLAEVLADLGLPDSARRLGRLRRLRPTGPTIAEGLRKLGVAEDDFVIEHERFELMFPSGREFLFAPVIEHGPLRMWKAILGKDGKPQEVFWRLKEVIDTYFAEHVFSVTTVAGLVHVSIPGDNGTSPLARRYWERYPELDAIFKGKGEADDVDDIDLDIDLDMDMDEDEDEDEEPEGVRTLEAPTREQADEDEQIFEQLERPGPNEEEGELESLLHEVLHFGQAEHAPAEEPEGAAEPKVIDTEDSDTLELEELSDDELEQAVEGALVEAARSGSRPMPPPPPAKRPATGAQAKLRRPPTGSESKPMVPPPPVTGQHAAVPPAGIAKKKPKKP